MMRRLGLLGAAVLVLGVVYVSAWRTQPAEPKSAAQPAAVSATVTSITRSCPPPAPGSGSAHIAMIASPSQAAGTKAGQAPAGVVTLNAVPAAPVPGAQATTHHTAGKAATTSSTPTDKPTAKPTATSAAPAAKPVTVSAPGTLATVAAPQAASAGGTALAASGQMAEGFEAEQATASGLGTVSCTHPSSDMWFVGTGTATGVSQVRLYLMNTGDLAASVDLTILTDSGLQTGPSSAITVAPDQFVMENIAPFIRGSQALALHVQTTSGQVAASVWEGGGSAGSGGAWLPEAAAPSTSLVIPGLTVASSAARLFITVPGAEDARVTVVAFTAQGRFPQFGGTTDAPAAATTSFPLTSLGASAAGLELISNVPITAAVLVPGEGVGSVTAATSPLTGQGVVAGNPAVRGFTVGLLLTAPASTARASITVVPSGAGLSAAAGSGDQQVATVQDGHTVAVTVPRPQGSRQPFAIVIRPLAGSGPLYAARVVTTGTGGLSASLVSLLPVPSALTVITLPTAQDSYSAILP
jgi:Family of unknown function (DUF5719)